MAGDRKRMSVVRVALRALVWLLAGAVVSVLVAEACVLYSDAPGAGQFFMMDYGGWASIPLSAPVLPLPKAPPAVAERLERLSAAFPPDWADWPGWGRSEEQRIRDNIYHTSAALDAVVYDVPGMDAAEVHGSVHFPYSSEATPPICYSGVVRAGWPARALGAGRLIDLRAAPPAPGDRAASYWVGGVAAPRLLAAKRDRLGWFGTKGDRRPILYGVRWAGFLLCTVFYASCLWLVLAGPFTLRRVLRKRRGRCTACGYNLAGLAGAVCPECGKGIHPPGE